MKYIPSRILPHTNWRTIDEHVLLNELGQECLVRFVTKKQLRCQDIFKSDDFWEGISTRLLSTQNKKCDVKWEVKNEKYNDPWDGNASSILNKSNKKAYYWIKKRNYIGIRISSIKNLSCSASTVTTQGLPDCIENYNYAIRHTPTRSNFWHCDIFLGGVLRDGTNIALNASQSLIDERKVGKVAKIVRKETIRKEILINKKELIIHYIPKRYYRKSL